MQDTLAFLYRLFAPLLVVLVVIAGVDLGSGLLQNSKQTQTALTIAHGMSCPEGGTPVSNCQPPGKPKNGGKDGLPCSSNPYGGTINGICQSGCCRATSFPSAGESAESQGLFSEMLKSLKDIMMMQSGSRGGSSYQTYEQAPTCKSLTAVPTIIAPGEGATLTWILDGGTPEATVVSPEIGLVQGYSVRVTPKVSTTYTVTVRNRIGSSECNTVRVHVGPGGEEDADAGYHVAGNEGEDSFDLWGADGGSDAQTADDMIWSTSATSSVTGTTSVNPQTGTSTIATDGYVSVDNTQYYYGDGGANSNIDWSLFTDDSADWGTVDFSGVVKEEDGGTYSFGNVVVDKTVGDGDIARDTSGLTESELYGVWNRPQSPTSGGFGVVGGGAGAGVDLTADTPSLFTRFTNWIKNIFCFWCGTSTHSLLNTLSQVAAAFVPSSLSGGVNQNDIGVHMKMVGSGQESYFSWKISEIIQTSGNSQQAQQGGAKPLLLEYTHKLPRYKASYRNGWFNAGVGTGITRRLFSWATNKPLTINIVDFPIQGIDVGKDGQDVCWSSPASDLEVMVAKPGPKKVMFYAAGGADVTKIGEYANAWYYEKTARDATYPNGWTELTLSYYEGGADMVCTPVLQSMDNATESKVTIKCDADKITIYSRAVAGEQSVSNTAALVNVGGANRMALHVNDNTPGVLGDYLVYCGEPPKLGNIQQSGYTSAVAPKTEAECKDLQTHVWDPQALEGQRCQPKPNATPDAQPCADGQAQVNGLCPAPQPQVGALCQVAGTGAPGLVVVENGKLICKTQADSAETERLAKEQTEKMRLQLEEQDRKAREALEAQRAAYEAQLQQQRQVQLQQQQNIQQNQQQAQQQALQQANQQRVAMERAQQQYTQQQKVQQQTHQQAQADTQKEAEQNWLRQLFAKAQGQSQAQPNLATKPVCKAFTVSDTNINLGEEVILAWEVEDARKIVIRPKVEIVTAEGKSTGKAKPTADTTYTLVATNPNGETVCETDMVRVTDPVCKTDNLHVALSVTPNTINRPSCDPEETVEDCDSDWGGKNVTIAWDITPAQCIKSCVFDGPDGLVNDSPETTYELTGLLRKTSTFGLSCIGKNGKKIEKEVTATVK